MLGIKQVVSFGSRFVDYKMGFFGAFVMGGVVFAINFSGTNEITGATTAALKQGAYTFLFGGVLMRGCEHLATRIKHRAVAIATAVVIPSAITLFLTFGMHTFKGTPKPFESTLPTIIIIPATAIWGFKKRRQLEQGNTFGEQF